MLTRHPVAADTTTIRSTVLIIACPSPLTAVEKVAASPDLRGCSEGSNCATQPASPYPTTPTVDMTFCLNADFQRINKTIHSLRMSGFYYEGLSLQQAAGLLKHSGVGTFLVRDSSDPRFLFALSVQTERGPTSIRIHYTQGQFRLDCEDSLVGFMPLFDCVVDLVEHYVRLSQSVKGSLCVWLDTTGRRDLPIRLYRPLYQRVHSLQHLCRLVIVQRVQAAAPHPTWFTDKSIESLDLPNTVKQYLREYRHPH